LLAVSRRGISRHILDLKENGRGTAFLGATFMGYKLYVGNLSYGVTASQLGQLFAQHGAVVSAEVILDTMTGRSKGFGFVEMGTEQEAQAVIASLHGKDMDGRALSISVSKETLMTKGIPPEGGTSSRDQGREGAAPMSDRPDQPSEEGRNRGMDELIVRIAELFANLIDEHLARIRAELSNDPASDWVRSVLQNVSDKERWHISALGAEEMVQSLADGQMHSQSLQKDDLSVSISTFPCPFQKARQRYYPDGYIEYVARMLTTTRQQHPGCHWVHFQFFRDGNMFYVQFTLHPNKDALHFSPRSFYPTELLNDEEKRRLARPA
jgi:RNA recognition motif-containing protein